ncbi:unnamed protein product [Paramecium sonneborni]|uniref:Transmembrane protein n=2 Tax=Paramecium sonneborni TaxID=65129 RepID=A0A8S1L8T7_9CILI|nr:unnamed protein product [Paramecium sonneborni]
MKILEYIWLLFILLFCQFSLSAQKIGQTLQLLDDIDPYQNLKIQVENKRTGFGFWFKYIAMKKLLSSNIINQGYDQNVQVKGYLIFISQGEEIEIVLYLIKDYSNNLINLKFMINSSHEQIFNYQFYEFEGIWIFTAVALDPLDNKVEIYLFNEQSVNNFIYNEYQINFQIPKVIDNYLGVYGKIQNFNLLAFTAKFSEFLVIQVFEKIGYNYEQFYSKIIQSYIFERLEPQEQRIQLVDDQYFDGEQNLKRTIFIEGSSFLIQGWVKLNEQVQDYGFLLLNLKFTEQDLIQTFPGDQILTLQYQLTPKDPLNCQFAITQQFNQNPNVYEPYVYSGQEVGLYYGLPFIYKQFISWHYIQYQSGNKNIPSSLYIYFSYNEMTIGANFYVGFQPYQFSNVNASIEIGGSTFAKSFLNGWISKLEFIYNNKDNKLFGLNCYPVCNNCFGPYDNQCLSCDPIYNRFYLALKNVCVCQIGYLESSDGLSCVLFEDNYGTSVIVRQKFDENDDINCYLGYFQFMNSCYQCPIGTEMLNCQDCINNQKEWYKNPICSWDFQQSLFSFRYTKRQEEFQDLYLINQPFSIQLCVGCAQFCSYQDSECYSLSGIYHLGQKVYVKCKQNFQFRDGYCKLKAPFCLIQNGWGICLKCEIGYYQTKNQLNCIQCPKDCLECHYDEIKDNVECDRCLGQYFTIYLGVCTRCGLNCKICQPDFNFQKQEPFLRCLECIDVKQYYILFNAIDCLKNTMFACQYAFQYLNYDHSITTLDIFFEPRDYDENVRTGCARCFDDVFTFSFVSQQCEFTQNQNVMCKSSVFDQYGNYICLIFYNQQYPSQTIYQQFYYCPLIDQCSDCLKVTENNQICLMCNIGYYSSYTGVCIKCPPELNCLMCEQNLKLFNNNYRNQIRAFYKYFVEGFKSNHFYNDYNQIFVQEQYTVKCTNCLESLELYNGKCIKRCPIDCESCIKINDENVCQSCPYTYLGKSLTVFHNKCLECPTYCSICIKRSQASILNINPYYQSTTNIYENICIKGFSTSYYYDQDLSIYQDCQYQPDQSRCFRSITINVQIYCQDGFQTDKNQINIQDLFSSNTQINHLLYFENQNIYSYANKNTVKEVIYDFEIVDGLENSCILPQTGYFQQSMSKYVFSAILIKLNMYSKQQIEISVLENYKLEGFTDIMISNITFIQSSTIKATIIIDSLFKLRTIFQNVKFGSLKKQQDFLILAKSQIFIQFKDTQFINILQSNINSQFIQIKIINSLSQFFITNVHFINCNFMHTILFNIINENSIRIQIQNLKITNMVLKNSTHMQLSNSNTDNQIIIQNLNLQMFLFDSSSFFNLTYFSLTKVTQILFQDSILSNTIFFTLNNFVELEDITLSQINLLQSSTLFISRSQSNQNPQFILKRILFDFIKYESQNPFIFIYQEDNKFMQLQLIDIQVQNAELTQLELFNNIDVSKNKIVLSGDYIIIQNLIVLREEDLPEITIINSNIVNIDNLVIISKEREQFLSFVCLNNKKFQQEYSLITFFQVININIQNSVFSNLTLYNQGILQILYDQKMSLISEIQYKTVILNQIKFERNLILKNLNQEPLGFISIIDQNQISIQFTDLLFQANLLNEFLEESHTISSLLIVVIAPRGIFSLKNSKLDYNIILNSTFSLLYINTKYLNISQSRFNNNNVINYTTLYYFVKDLTYSITSIYSQTGNGYLKTSNLLINEVQFNTSQGFYGGGLQISSQNISTILITNCQFNNLSNLVGNSLSYGAALYLEIQSQELSLKFRNITVIQVFTENLGGFLFIKSSIYQKIQIDFQNSIFKDNFANSGSILYFDNSINSNQYFCKLSLTEIIVEQSKYDNYFKTLRFESQDQFNNIFLKQRELINIKMCSIELNNSFFLNLAQEGIVTVEQSFETILANLQVDNAKITNQYLFNILSYNDIMLNNIQIMNTQNLLNYKSMKRICKFDSFGQVDCFSLQNQTQNSHQQICIQTELNFLIESSKSTLIYILQQAAMKTIFMRNIKLLKNQVNQLINIQGLVKQRESAQIIVQALFSNKNQCLDSCITIQPITKQQIEILTSKSISIQNYYCLENNAQYGGCLQIFQFSVGILDSFFLNNTAVKQGGAIFYEGNSLILQNSQISYNQANQGGGIFTNIQLPISIEQKAFKANNAIYFGNDFVEIPSKLALIVDNFKNILFPQEFYINESIHLDQIEISNYTMFDKSITNYIYFPTGQQIGQYQFFDQKQNKFINSNLTLRVIALNRQNDIMRNLNNSSCTMFSDNQQILIKTKFNESSQDFYFDDQIIKFDPYNDQYLELKVRCDCVKVLNSTKSNENNYQLQFKIKTFPCKIGEIFENDQCRVCDYSQDLYSVTIKSTKCSKRNELTTSQVTSGQLRLRQGFWRFHQNSDDILQCAYSQTKCKGGWETGDDSCEGGYVGALCEQCDIYGTRGSEKFQNLFKYSCQQCSSQSYTIFYYIILNIWNILAIGITAFIIKNDFNKLFRVFWFSTISCNKIFLHYFQIIFYLTMLQLNIPIQLSSIINFLGNPTESISFLLDCVWSNYETAFNIIYIRAIIQLFSPILYLIIISVFILLILRIESETRQHLFYNSLQYCKLYYSPSIFSCLISLISYREIAGQKWILADVTYLFDTKEHTQWILQFIIPIFTLFLLLLVVDFVAIFKRKHQLTLLKTKMMFGYLYLNYKSRFYFWEYCKLIQKFLLVIVFLQFQDQIVWKATFVVLIILVYQQLVLILQPYKASLFNNLESLMQVICLETIIFSILIVQSEQYNLKFIEICSYILLTIINAYFLLKLLKIVLKLNSFQVQKLLDKLSSKMTQLCPQIKQYKFCQGLIYKRLKRSNLIRNQFQNLVRQIILMGKNRFHSPKKQNKGRISIRYFQQDFDTLQQLTITNTNLPQMCDNQRMLKTNTEFNQDDDGLDTQIGNKNVQPKFQI